MGIPPTATPARDLEGEDREDSRLGEGRLDIHVHPRPGARGEKKISVPDGTVGREEGREGLHHGTLFTPRRWPAMFVTRCRTGVRTRIQTRTGSVMVGRGHAGARRA